MNFASKLKTVENEEFHRKLERKWIKFSWFSFHNQIFPDKNLLISSLLAYLRLGKNNLLRNADMKYEQKLTSRFLNKIFFAFYKQDSLGSNHRTSFTGCRENEIHEKRLPLDTNKNVNQMCQNLTQQKPERNFPIASRKKFSEKEK